MAHLDYLVDVVETVPDITMAEVVIPLGTQSTFGQRLFQRIQQYALTQRDVSVCACLKLIQ